MTNKTDKQKGTFAKGITEGNPTVVCTRRIVQLLADMQSSFQKSQKHLIILQIPLSQEVIFINTITAHEVSNTSPFKCAQSCTLKNRNHILVFYMKKQYFSNHAYTLMVVMILLFRKCRPSGILATAASGQSTPYYLVWLLISISIFIWTARQVNKQMAVTSCTICFRLFANKQINPKQTKCVFVKSKF